ncbi:MAG: GNAT family N-acetyltransferase [Flavobacteriaceae bacterium]|nr:GNAT family N-acetyltransferase [Flavobacteriaceae bacterium]
MSVSNEYYDAESPYGYSGPIFSTNVIDKEIILFWKEVDSWYKKNKVVTEFIRFSLNGNQKYYSGQLIPTLNNIKGKIIDFDSLWGNFKQKVRNNYRKSLKHNLKAKIYSKDINNEIISKFYYIYIKSLKRNNAAKNFFYSKSYFENLIKNNLNNIIIALIFKDDIPISTELIVIERNVLYSHLGGTLAEYFNLRPNDFLKIEVIKWAINNEISYYLLGGGRENKDGLYKYKKSFFPKDEDVIFYTGRKVINQEAYHNLIKQITVDYSSVNTLIGNSNVYFPIYKKNAIPPTLSIISSKSEWKKVLDEVRDFDFYHTYDYHNLSKSTDEEAILIKYTEGEILIALPLIIRKIENSDYFDATSVYGYSGPLLKNCFSKFNNSNFKIVLNEYFIKAKIISVFSRLNPFILNQDLVLNGIGEIKALGNIVNIDLTKDIEEQRTIFSKTTKRFLNKGRKYLNVRISNSKEDILEFKNLYYENMDRVNAEDMYYFDDDYFLKFINSKDFKTELLFAINNETGENVSAAMMVKTNGIIQYHISGTKTDFLNLSPMRLLIDEMRIRGTKEGYEYFNLGGGLGNKDDELFRFKSSFSKDFKPFKVWKHISNIKVYNNLVKEKGVDLKVDFFPLYRYDNSSHS